MLRGELHVSIQRTDQRRCELIGFFVIIESVLQIHGGAKVRREKVVGAQCERREREVCRWNARCFYTATAQKNYQVNETAQSAN